MSGRREAVKIAYFCLASFRASCIAFGTAYPSCGPVRVDATMRFRSFRPQTPVTCFAASRPVVATERLTNDTHAMDRQVLMRIVRLLLTPPRQLAQWALALLIVFEEWGWYALARWLGLLARLPALRALKARIRTLPPYAALAVFALPTLLLVPVKLAALWLISRRHAGLGLLVILGAKVLGTAIVARLFLLTRDQLMQLAWFARGHARWQMFKGGLLTMVRTSTAWRAARALKHRLRKLARRRVD